ncbi:hypothetical protein R6Z07F_010184 [Ovis aries]
MSRTGPHWRRRAAVRLKGSPGDRELCRGLRLPSVPGLVTPPGGEGRNTQKQRGMVTAGSPARAASPEAAACSGLEAPAPRSGGSLQAAASPPTQSPPRLSLDSRLLPPRFPVPDQRRRGGPGPTLVPAARPSCGRAVAPASRPATPPAQQAAALRMEPLGVKGVARFLPESELCRLGPLPALLGPRAMPVVTLPVTATAASAEKAGSCCAGLSCLLGENLLGTTHGQQMGVPASRGEPARWREGSSVEKGTAARAHVRLCVPPTLRQRQAAHSHLETARAHVLATKDRPSSPQGVPLA